MAANPISELNDVAHQIARLEHALGAAKHDRDVLIREAVARGYSEREIARAALMTGPRVHQIKENAR